MAEAKKSTKAPAKPRKTAAKKTAAPDGAGAIKASLPNGEAHETPMKASGPRPGSISREEIAKLAHRYWTENGRQHGKHEEDWYRAEQELRKTAS